MKLIKKLTAYILVFALLAGTVAVMSAAVSPRENDENAAYSAAETAYIEPTENAREKTDVAPVAENSYSPRLSAPSYANKYYFSDSNIFYKYGYGMPNCTCYAWGRAYELLNKTPDLCVYSAYLWYDYNKENGYYPYGTEPKLGAIACWVYSSGTSGHVAVVEKIENGTITFSNSAYGGDMFYLTTSPVNDPSNGRGSWIFQGYIYIGDFGSGNYTSQPTESDDNNEPEGDVYRVTSDTGVNLRSGAGTSYPIVGGLAYQRTVTVTKTQKAGGYTWGYTETGGVSGWFVTDFAELIKKAETPTQPETTQSEPTQPAPTEAPAPTERPTESQVTEPASVKPTETVQSPTAPTQPKSTLPFEYAPRPDRNIVMGDLDSDGKVTILDATRIQLIIAELFVPTKYMLIVGDYDGDSSFSIMDASRIGYDIAFERI